MHKYDLTFKLLFICLLTLLPACSTHVAPAATQTPEPTLTPTIRPSATPIPIRYVTIGSPFPKEWGTPLIWSNDSWNGPVDFSRLDDRHGHVDISVPKGYSIFEGYKIDNHVGDVISPINACITPYYTNTGELLGIHLDFIKNEYPEGILDALKFSGINDPDLKKVGNIRIDLGHVKEVKIGCFKKGDVIAEIEPFNNRKGQTKVGFQFWITYNKVDYGFSPTLFKLDEEWDCFPGSPYDCTPEPNDYAKK